MARLAKAASGMRVRYDVVVVGSGYGGGVAAARLARAGLSVCLLERGREILPGEFPDTLLGAQREFQLHGRGKRLGSATALFDMRMGEDVHVVSGCGLGGTSLINANVCLTPHEKIFEDLIWPSRMRYDHWLDYGYWRARQMLRPRELPEDSTPPKLEALQIAAQKTGHSAVRVPLHIAFETGENAAGVMQSACTQCGDCMSGCNVGAKTTVHSTYLSEAASHGAEIFTECAVRYVEQVGDRGGQDCRWRIIFQRADGAGSIVGRRSLLADNVIIAAGTMGSNEIMMRSRQRGLAVSPMLGKRFCTNADAIAMGYNNDILINGIGTGRQDRRKAAKVGPGVAGMIDLRAGLPLEEQLVIVEAAIQSAMAPLLPLLFSAGGAFGDDLDSGLADRLHESARTLQSLALGAYVGAVAQTQTFLAVGHDDSSGEIMFEDDRVAIKWPAAAAQPVFKRIEQALRPIIAATGGTYVPNPVSSRWLGGNLLTVHPLGGCVMGDHAGVGVVDHKCRVFAGDASQNGTGDGAAASVYEGLYVCDGSVIPRPLGVHPLFTITAVAERAMALLLRDKGLSGGLYSGALAQQAAPQVLPSASATGAGPTTGTGPTTAATADCAAAPGPGEGGAS